MTFNEFADNFEKKEYHHTYYGQYVNGMIKFVISCFMGKIIEKANLNEISWKEWDENGKRLTNLVNRKLAEKNGTEINLNFLIGVAKEAARQIKKGE